MGGKQAYRILLWVLVGVAVLIVGGVLTYNALHSATSVREEDERNTLKQALLAVTHSDHVYGARDATVTLIKYSDIECQYCRSLYPRLKEIVDSYPEGAVSLVYRHIPLFYQRGEVGQEELASECVYQEKGEAGFFAFLEAVFRLLPLDETIVVSEEVLVIAADEVGVPEDTLLSCIERGAYREDIEENHRTGGALGVVTIPHTFIVFSEGVYEVVGSKSFTTYKTIIDSILAGE